MTKKKSLWRKNRYGKWYKLTEQKNKKIKFIPADEFSQTFTWHKTNKSEQLKKSKS